MWVLRCKCRIFPCMLYKYIPDANGINMGIGFSVKIYARLYVKRKEYSIKFIYNVKDMRILSI